MRSSLPARWSLCGAVPTLTVCEISEAEFFQSRHPNIAMVMAALVLDR
jgi:hypothetical protein